MKSERNSKSILQPSRPTKPSTWSTSKTLRSTEQQSLRRETTEASTSYATRLSALGKRGSRRRG